MQPKRAIFSEDNLNYKYMPLGDGTADVFIYKYIGENTEESEEGNTPSFIYEFNEFNVKVDEITEEMISASPLEYLNYQPAIVEITLEQRVRDLEEMWLEELLGGDEE